MWPKIWVNVFVKSRPSGEETILIALSKPEVVGLKQHLWRYWTRSDFVVISYILLMVCWKIVGVDWSWLGRLARLIAQSPILVCLVPWRIGWEFKEIVTLVAVKLVVHPWSKNCPIERSGVVC